MSDTIITQLFTFIQSDFLAIFLPSSIPLRYASSISSELPMLVKAAKIITPINTPDKTPPRNVNM